MTAQARPAAEQPPAEGRYVADGRSATQPPVPGDRILTWPNLLSTLRLVGVPVFLWLLLAGGHGAHSAARDGIALAVLAVSGFTDWADGVLARRLNAVSRLGTLLDPLVDRLYILATLVGLVLRHVIPWQLAAVLVGRDLVLLATVPLLRRRGLLALPVHYVGKAATFALLYAFPCLLLGTYHGAAAAVAKPVAWALTIWGTALYLVAGVIYLLEVGALMRVPKDGT